MRPDLELIAQLVNDGARVLDLGCGEGDLLAHLQVHKNVNGYGLDVDPENICTCLAKGVNVIEQDLNEGIGNFPSNSFDMVVMTDTLQSVESPQLMIKEMLRVAEECVITFPNFGYWRCRVQLMFGGRMPVGRALPYEWYNTPNIRLCTFKDFEALCSGLGARVLQKRVVNHALAESAMSGFIPNLLGPIAFYRLGRAS